MANVNHTQRTPAMRKKQTQEYGCMLKQTECRKILLLSQDMDV